ncbi:MAG: DUF1028 domain-containing protein [Actinomycetia bacterium]|nr:DUF1028 domain-containing protein [Actinomycetes bacterium]
MTFSVAGHCARTGAMGVAITSSSPAVAARCAWVRGGVGAVTTQNVTDPRLGPAMLDALERGAEPDAVLRDLVAVQPEAKIAWRQLTIVDRNGTTAAWTGQQALGVHAQVVRPGVVVAGNLLSSPSVLDAAADAFEDDPSATLGTRLIAGLSAALVAGGEAGPVHSAGMAIADRDPIYGWPVTDLRVDWHEAPVAELERLWAIWQPQEQAYLSRALEPDSSPSYGVPGDVR